MIIVVKTTAILNLMVRMARLWFFPLNEHRGSRRKPMGNQWSISASMNQSLDMSQKDSCRFLNLQWKSAWQTAPEIWSEKLWEESGPILVLEWPQVSCLSGAFHRSVCRFQDQSCRASWVSAVWSYPWTSIPCGHHRPVAWPGPSSYAWICCWVVRNAWFWRIGQEGHAWGIAGWTLQRRVLKRMDFQSGSHWFWRRQTGPLHPESCCWRWRCCGYNDRGIQWRWQPLWKFPWDGESIPWHRG